MIILIIAGLTLLALLAKLYGFERLQAVETTTILLVGGFILLAGLLWQMQRDKMSTYDALDMLMDNGRASLESHITLIMAGLAIWWIVTETLAGKDVSETIVQVLLIFVVYRGAKKIIDVVGSRSAMPSPDVQQDIQQQVVLEAPKAPTVPRPPPPKKFAAKLPTRTASGKTIPKDE